MSPIVEGFAAFRAILNNSSDDDMTLYRKGTACSKDTPGRRSTSCSEPGGVPRHWWAADTGGTLGRSLYCRSSREFAEAPSSRWTTESCHRTYALQKYEPRTRGVGAMHSRWTNAKPLRCRQACCLCRMEVMPPRWTITRPPLTLPASR